jgi:hypothetical protein
LPSAPLPVSDEALNTCGVIQHITLACRSADGLNPKVIIRHG